MTDQEWSDVLVELTSHDVDTAVKAAAKINDASTAADVPRLLGLLKSTDFFEREAAAWPLAELAGPDVLPQLLEAYQLGFEQGHDNDGFTAALLEIPVLHPELTPRALAKLIEQASEPMRSHAKWLQKFC